MTRIYDRPARVSRPVETTMRGAMRLALIVGLAAAALGVVGIFVSGSSLFFQGYLLAFLFWLGLSLGSLALLLLHFLAGGRWGLSVRRVAEAGAANIGLMALLFLPLLLGLNDLFPWVRGEWEPHGNWDQLRTVYLTVPFFLARAAVYFLAWIALVWAINGRINRLAASATPEEATARRAGMQGLAAGGMILYVLTMSFAAMDWIMTLQPYWNSSIFGLIIIVGQLLSAMAFALVIINLLPGFTLGRRWTHATTPVPFSDLGALLLVFVIGFAYLAYFQYLIIWAANIPREVVWYLDRYEGGWNVLATIVAIFQFVLPFIILLSFRARHSLRVLGGLGLMLLVVYLLNLFWHVKPAFSPGRFAVSWLDLVLPVAMGGLWIAMFFYNLLRRPQLSHEERVVLNLSEEAERALT
jgi:hypothetical protein